MITIDINVINQNEIRDRLVANAARPDANPALRKPENAHGFLSLERATEILASEDRLVCWSNDAILHSTEDEEPVVFFSGGFDNWELLQDLGFHSCSIGRHAVAPRPSLPSGFISTPQDMLTIYYSKCKFLSNEEDLVNYFRRYKAVES